MEAVDIPLPEKSVVGFRHPLVDVFDTLNACEYYGKGH